MEKLTKIFFVGLVSLGTTSVLAQQKQLEGVEGCFILHDLKADKQLIRYGGERCAERVPACSTFKVPLSLMAFDKGVLKDENHVIKWDGVAREIPSWNKDQTAASWMRESVVWYSQAMTPKFGKDVIEKYLTDFGFGSHDMSGGIKDAWLTVTPSTPNVKNTLKISADEQVLFIVKLFKGQLPVSKHALDTTKKIMFLEKSSNGFELNGKTGSGYLSVEPDKVRVGWFVSHVKHEDQELVAITSFTDKRKDPPYKYGGYQAKEITKSILTEKGYWTDSTSKDPAKLQLINLGDSFETFWSKAKDKTLPEQLNLWNIYIEKPNQAFYDTVVWNHTNAAWRERRQKILSDTFSKYPKLYPKIHALFASFSKEFEQGSKTFLKIFPDASSLSAPIYLAPGPTFNGKSAILKEGKHETVILAFGADMISERDDALDILLPHELFHLYHALKSDIKNDGIDGDAKLMLPLWAEGLATYVSSVITPGKSDAELLMDRAFANVSPKEVLNLAASFLKVRNELVTNVAAGSPLKAWFAIGDAKVRSDLPNRCGYFLGLHVVRHLAKTNSLYEMTHWTKPEVYSRVASALEELANKK